MKRFLSFLIYTIIITNTTNCSTPKYYSQYGQDKFAHEKFFNNKKDGIFVDIGAHDGISYSNTYFFEKHLEWQGICIEPLPKVFEDLTTNRNCICINGCIADTTQQKKFLQVNG
jgi:hypothetical protein